MCTCNNFGCENRSICLAPFRKISVTTSFLFGLYNFSTDRLSKRKIDTSYENIQFQSSIVQQYILFYYLSILFPIAIVNLPSVFRPGRTRLITDLKKITNGISKSHTRCRTTIVPWFVEHPGAVVMSLKRLPFLYDPKQNNYKLNTWYLI